MAENVSPGAPIADQEEVKVQSGRARALAAADLPDKVHTWPYLVRAEFISGCVLLLVLMVWSITVDAPMEEPANPTKTPNPSKAPWYFLGLQEMLVYFDPWIAGVLLPSLIIVGLMIIPYVDINPKGNGYYTWSERKFAISTFLVGFLGMWVGMMQKTRRRSTILIVDDEQDNLDVLREVLELEGQEVRCSRTGPEALALFDRGERFDLVLCDVGMPEMSGWQVAREIERIAPGTPVWMLTGWANEIGEQDPRRRYVRGVLAKPLDLDQLRSLLTPSPQPTAPAPNASAMH
jgi:CheY-like chemotaxis protein